MSLERYEGQGAASFGSLELVVIGVLQQLENESCVATVNGLCKPVLESAKGA